MFHEYMLRSLLLRLDPETAHACVMNLLKVYERMPDWDSEKRDVRNLSEYFGLTFKNPLGLAAGFDKNAELLYAWQKMGFGFAEVGTVTALAQPGNPQPRIFRLPKHKMLLNRMGFNNDGAHAIAKRIEKQRKCFNITIPIGVNIGKSKAVSLSDAAKDYEISFKALADVADYIVINVSSPNTPELINLQASDRLNPLLENLCSANAKRYKKIPLILKLSPDMDVDNLKQLADCAIDYGLVGLIVSNTSTDFNLIPEAKKFGEGGISGGPLFKKSTECLKVLAAYLDNKLVLIANGGILTAQNALEKFRAGAHLIQIYTGFIYEGPSLIRMIDDVCSLSIEKGGTNPP